MNYEHWISYRYMTAKKDGFLSFLNFISIAGVAIGVMSLIVVTGVMTGFGNNLREKIIGTMPHVLIDKEVGIKEYKQIIPEIENIKGVSAASPYIQGNIFVEQDGHSLGVMIRGIDPQKESKITKVNQYLKEGRMQDLKSETIVIGSELARYFGYTLGDTMTLISPGSGIAGKGWRYKVKIVGIFNTGMADYDMNLVIVSLSQAQKIFDLEENIATGIGVRLQNIYDAKEIKNKIYSFLGYSYSVRTWIDMNRNLFEALFLEKWGLFIVLTLMVLVASFNIISTLIVTVTSKIHDIGILKSLGVTNKSIRRIFTKQGIYIGCVGVFWGLILGLAVSFILRTYVKVPKEIYSIDRVPVELQPFDILATVM
ncbi:MAG TPA: ABC transporter permease, partial [Candidatus Omnitrophota bacterium]|nr:ABC transporter permease [Candidatus Omnitrophota bacterium]